MIGPLYHVTGLTKWRRFANNFIIMLMSIFLIIVITKAQYVIVPRSVLFWRIAMPISSFIWEMFRYNKHFAKMLTIHKRKKLIKKQIQYEHNFIVSELMPNVIEVIYLAVQFINAAFDILFACLLIN